MARSRVTEVGEYEFNDFTPSELATVTGLGIDMQRVWRKRGHLPPSNAARASFETREVLAIAIRYELSKLGVSPRFSDKAAALAVPALLASILLNRAQAVAVYGTINQVARITTKMASSADIACHISGSDGHSRFLWTCSPPEFELIAEISEITDRAEVVGYVMIALDALGIKLAERSPKPFVIIQAT